MLKRAMKLLSVVSVVLLIGLIFGATSVYAAEEITVWAFGAEGEALELIIEPFVKKTPEIKVNPVAVPWGEANAKLVAAVSAWAGPDVSMIPPTWIADFDKMGMMTDLKEWLQKYEKEVFPSIWERAWYKGKMLVAPWSMEVRANFYRTDMLDEVGIGKIPDDWNEFVETVVALKKVENGEVTRWGALLGSDMMRCYMLQAGGKMLSDDATEVLINSPEALEGVQFLWDLYHKYQIAPTEGTFGWAGAGEFVEGYLPVLTDAGPWAMPPIRNQAPELEEEGRWEPAMYPAHPETGRRDTLLGGADFFVPEFSENKEAAVKFLAWMMSVEGGLQLKKYSGLYPINMRAWDDPMISEDPFTAPFKEAAARPDAALFPWPHFPGSGEAERIKWEANERVMRGIGSPKEVLEWLAAELEKVIPKN